MRKPEDGDIKPTRESIEAAYKVLESIVELIGDDDENAAELKNDMEMMKNNLMKPLKKVAHMHEHTSYYPL